MVNFFNRIVVGLLLVGLVLLTVYALAITLDIAQPSQTLLGPVVGQQLTVLQEWEGQNWWLAFGALLVAAVGLSYVLLWELRAGRSRRDPLTVELSDKGVVTVEQRSVIQLVEQAVKALPEVRHVKVDVFTARADGIPAQIRVACRVSAASSAALPHLGQQVQDVTKTRVEEQLGLIVTEVQAKIDFDAVRIDRRVLD